MIDLRKCRYYVVRMYVYETLATQGINSLQLMLFKKLNKRWKLEMETERCPCQRNSKVITGLMITVQRSIYTFSKQVHDLSLMPTLDMPRETTMQLQGC